MNCFIENLLLQIPKYEIKSKLHHKRLIRIIRNALISKDEKVIDDKEK